MSDTKLCSVCNLNLPFSEEYFYRDYRTADGLHPICKGCFRNYYNENKEYISDSVQRRLLRPDSRNKKRVTNRRYNKSEKGRAAGLRYNRSPKGKEAQRRANKNRYKRNKLSLCVASMMRSSLNMNKDNIHWEELVDYSIGDLRVHLESLFKPGMCWENYGRGGWHIDHKIPISHFNISSYNCDDFKKCWSLENLQPLWETENLKKYTKIM